MQQHVDLKKVKACCLNLPHALLHFYCKSMLRRSDAINGNTGINSTVVLDTMASYQLQLKVLLQAYKNSSAQMHAQCSCNFCVVESQNHRSQLNYNCASTNPRYFNHYKTSTNSVKLCVQLLFVQNKKSLCSTIFFCKPLIKSK